MAAHKGRTLVSLSIYHLRAWLYLRQGGRCLLCREPLDPTATPLGLGGTTLEHVIPRSLGGTNDRDNLALSHWECNQARRNDLQLRRKRPGWAHKPRYVLFPLIEGNNP